MDQEAVYYANVSDRRSEDIQMVQLHAGQHVWQCLQARLPWRRGKTVLSNALRNPHWDVARTLKGVWGEGAILVSMTR